jgi:hypothetical protein
LVSKAFQHKHNNAGDKFTGNIFGATHRDGLLLKLLKEIAGVSATCAKDISLSPAASTLSDDLIERLARPHLAVNFIESGTGSGYAHLVFVGNTPLYDVATITDADSAAWRSLRGLSLNAFATKIGSVVPGTLARLAKTTIPIVNVMVSGKHCRCGFDGHQFLRTDGLFEPHPGLQSRAAASSQGDHRTSVPRLPSVLPASAGATSCTLPHIIPQPCILHIPSVARCAVFIA